MRRLLYALGLAYLATACHRDRTLCPEGATYAACVSDSGPESGDATPTCEGQPLVEACGNCGTRTRTCVDGVVGAWSACSGEGVCTPSQEKRVTGTCAGPEETRWAKCSSACALEESCRPEKGWRAIADATGILTARHGAHAAWTGKVFLVWGGLRDTSSGELATNDGAAYDPATDTWKAITPPPANVDLLASVWAGTRIFAWGGGSAGNAGATYDPVADLWTPLPTTTLAARSEGHMITWMPGSGEVLVSHGRGDGCSFEGCTDAAAFDLAAKSWRAVPSLPTGAPALTEFGGWTGTEVTFATLAKTFPLVRYTPSTNSWSVTADIEFPTMVTGRTAALLSSEGIFVLGSTASAQWRWDGGWLVFAGHGTTTSATQDATAWVQGNLVYVWSGKDASGKTVAGGARVDMTTMKWESLDGTNEPAPRTWAAKAQSDRTLFVWGGLGADGKDLASGGIFTPP